MIGAIGSELLILRKWAATWILLGIWLSTAIFFGYGLPYATGANTPVSDMFPENVIGNLVPGFPFFGGVIALILAVMTVGGEYGWGTWKTLLIQRPTRTRVFAAKMAALAIVLVPFAALLFAVGGACSIVVAAIEDAPVSWPSLSTIVRGVAAGWLILAIWGALGVMLVTLIRSTALAMGVGLLYAFVVEGLLSAFADGISLLNPLVELYLRANTYSVAAAAGGSAESARDNGPGAFSGPYVAGEQAIIVLGIYALLFLLVSAFVFHRRDIA